jgi:demethylmenaquinone methyltransferase/2-methoxy-6-polyprenyl-1,4-benzoquinol methylase
MLMSVDKSAGRVRRMFAEIAPRYDLLNHLLSMQADRYWRWRTVRLTAPQAGRPILDVCTGTGDLALAFFRKTRGAATIVGADFCREMLLVGQRKKRRRDARGAIALVEADAQQLPFADDRFQVVSAAFGIRNVADADQGLREMVRVCEPGGRVAVLEFSLPRRPLGAIYGWYFRRILPRVGQRLARNDQRAYNYLTESVGQFLADEAFVARMRAAGVKQVRSYRLTLGIATLYIGVK